MGENFVLGAAPHCLAIGGSHRRTGVSGQRLAVVGYGDQRPVSTNAAQNRRVEVMILPSTVRSTVVKTSGKAAPAHTAKPATPGLNKDANESKTVGIVGWEF